MIGVGRGSSDAELKMRGIFADVTVECTENLP